MKIVCRSCQAENAVGTSFCRECGASFDFIQKWEPYGFQPLSMYSLNKMREFSKAEWIFFWLLFVDFVVYIFIAICSDGAWPYSFYNYFGTKIWILCSIIAVLGLPLAVFCAKKRIKSYLMENVDFIQASKGRYKFFMKNDKMGLIDEDRYRITIPATYDILQWNKVGKFVNASNEEGQYVFSVKGDICG